MYPNVSDEYTYEYMLSSEYSPEREFRDIWKYPRWVSHSPVGFRDTRKLPVDSVQRATRIGLASRDEPTAKALN
jgi:hypothetical protein